MIATCQSATVKGGSNPTGGYGCIDFVLCAAGQAILANHGFSNI